MDAHTLITLLLFISTFLVGITALQSWSNKTGFPFTVALLGAGFLTQFVTHALHLNLHLTLSSNIIYFLLLPILLFEAAQHLIFHQFKLQFKTITAFATVGVVISIAVVTAVIAITLGMPVGPALLFGAIISATDPIAVLALFKSLGAPKRLGLVADGESMFNDATGVIAFKVVSTFVVAGTVFETSKLTASLGNFLYVFIGSMIFGAVFGYVGTQLAKLVKNDRVLNMAISLATGLGSFVAAEHFFHFSGVISTVIAGIVFGNVGRISLSHHILHWTEQMWEVLGFVSLSLVFFFAAFNMHLEIFGHYGFKLVYVVLAVLLARAASVYLTAAWTNKSRLFSDEPNMPMSWQHIMNWGGLRGVIPLVLAYSLPEDYAYREDMLAFTLISLLFTLIVNGLTIKKLLLALGLHLPQKEEAIVKEEAEVYHYENALHNLTHLEKSEFSKEIIAELKAKLTKAEKVHRDRLVKMSSSEELRVAVQLQCIAIERDVIDHLLDDDHINASVHTQFSTQLDIQQDVLEYPEIYARAIDKNGRLTNQETMAKKLKRMRKLAAQIPLLKNLLDESEDQTIRDRYALLRARNIASEAVIGYIDRVESSFKEKTDKAALATVRRLHQKFISDNTKEIKQVGNKYKGVVTQYQKSLAESLILSPSTHIAH
jgi:monovalent cation:H+ antiporter, CPA1 family